MHPLRQGGSKSKSIFNLRRAKTGSIRQTEHAGHVPIRRSGTPTSVIKALKAPRLLLHQADAPRGGLTPSEVPLDGIIFSKTRDHR
jgi:hypothetical protein